MATAAVIGQEEQIREPECKVNRFLGHREATKVLVCEIHEQGVPIAAIAKTLGYHRRKIQMWVNTDDIPQISKARWEEIKQKLLELLDSHKSIERKIISLLATGPKSLSKLSRFLGFPNRDVLVYLQKMEGLDLVHRGHLSAWFLSRKGLEEARWIHAIDAKRVQGELLPNEKEYLKQLTLDQQLVFYGLVLRGHGFNATDYRTVTGRAYHAYCRVATAMGVQPVALGTYRKYIRKLSDIGLIETRMINRGQRHGRLFTRARTKAIKLAFRPSEELLRAMLEDIKEWLSERAGSGAPTTGPRKIPAGNTSLTDGITTSTAPPCPAPSPGDHE